MNKLKHKYLILWLCACPFFWACKKDNLQAGEKLEIYLLSTTQFVSGACQVDPSKSVVQDSAFIKNEDILSYSSSNYQFIFTKSAYDKIKTLNPRTVLVVAVDKQLIYYSVYFPIYFNSICDKSIVWDFNLDASNGITMKLGYPGMIQGSSITDNRNDPTILATLKSQGKLL